jgi:hypothetical protein
MKGLEMSEFFDIGQRVRIYDNFNRLDEHVGELGRVTHTLYAPPIMDWVAVVLEEDRHEHVYWRSELRSV